ncbi:hypothetical protein ACFY3O_07115 [Streptomyces sp. NPDC001046]
MPPVKTLTPRQGQDDHREHCARPFGTSVTLPAPFALDLDTAGLL